MKKQLLIAFCLMMGFTGCGMTKEPVNLHDEIPDFEHLSQRKEGTSAWWHYPDIEQQLLHWHPYGSSFEALKQRIINGGGRYSQAFKEKWVCGDKTVGCNNFYYPHFFYVLDRKIVIDVGEEDGKIVFLEARAHNKNL